ncbi:MAG: hypothetical protein K2N20_07805, partial [Helicobacter sp.]|nr:hypothetical protein [Helicobacter sp.]
LFICALRLYMSRPTALRLCYAFGSNIDVARCGWDARICEQWQRDVSALPQHDKWRCGFNRTYQINKCD